MKNKTLYILDMDRTIVDVVEVMAITKIVCGEMGVDFEKIYSDQQDLQGRGTAYSPFKFIAGHSHIDIDVFKDRFCELASDNKLLFSDAQKLIDRLQQEGYDYMLLTHGVDDDWQKLKMKAAKLIHKPYVIVKDRYKSRIIAKWLQDGLVRPELPGLGSYSDFIFVDDRDEAFVDFPETGQGYLIDRFSRFDESLKLPKNVVKIKDLSEV